MNHLGPLNQEQYDSLTDWQKVDRRLKELEKQNNNLHQTCKEQKTIIENYREMHEAHHDFTSESDDHRTMHCCWMWGEENHLESLSCPVLIPADWLRALLQQARDEGKRQMMTDSQPDTDQVAMSIENNELTVPAYRIGD